MVKPRHVHHAISVPLGAIAGVAITLERVSAKATELTETVEVTQTCLDLIQRILSVF